MGKQKSVTISRVIVAKATTTNRKSSQCHAWIELKINELSE
jgi:hypothetical protein